MEEEEEKEGKDEENEALVYFLLSRKIKNQRSLLRLAIWAPGSFAADVPLSLFLSVCLSVCLSVGMRLFISWSVCLSFCLYVDLSTRLATFFLSLCTHPLLRLWTNVHIVLLFRTS